jgi:ornithine decarboxylase
VSGNAQPVCPPQRETAAKEMFRKSHFPRVSMNPQDANYAYLRGQVELVPLSMAEGKIAAEGALPYPPGVLCVVPGEIWGDPFCVTSKRWKKASTCCRASRQSCRGLYPGTRRPQRSVVQRD